MAKNEIDVKDEHRYSTKKQGKREIGYRDIERRRLIPHLDQHKLIRGDREDDREKSDQNLPEEKDKLPERGGELAEKKLDDHERSTLVQGWNRDKNHIGHEENGQLKDPRVRPVEKVTAHDLQQDDQGQECEKERAEPQFDILQAVDQGLVP